MKPASSALLTLLGGSQFFMADCYTFTLADGTTYRYTTADQNVTDQATGNVFAAKGPFFERSKIKFQIGVQVDELDIVVTAGPNDLLEGAPFLSALRVGVLDGAEVQLDRAFMATFGDTSAGLVTIFAGRVVEVNAGRTQATIKANTHLELLNLQWPRLLFQPGCQRALYDAGCTLNPATYAQAGTVAAGVTGTLSMNAVVATPGGSGSYNLGYLKFTSGPCAGVVRTIRSWNPGPPVFLQFLSALPVQPNVGDSFTAYPGCDKQLATCKLFGNDAHFAGQPFIPVPETAV